MGVFLCIILVLLNGIRAVPRFYPGTVIRDYMEENEKRMPLDWIESLYVSRSSTLMVNLPVDRKDKDYERSFEEYPPKEVRIMDDHFPFCVSKRFPDVLDIVDIPRPLVVQFSARMPITQEGYYSEGNVILRLLEKKEEILVQEISPQDEFAIMFGVIFSIEGEYMTLELKTNNGFVGTTSHLYKPDGDGHSYTLELGPVPNRSEEMIGGRTYRMLRDGILVEDGVLAELGKTNECGTLERKQSYFFGHGTEETSLFEYDYSYPKDSKGYQVDLINKYGEDLSLATIDGIKRESIVDEEGRPNIRCLREICGWVKAPMKMKDGSERLLENIERRYPSCHPRRIQKSEWNQNGVEIVHPVDYMFLEAITSFGELSFGGIYVGVETSSAKQLRNLSYSPGVLRNSPTAEPIEDGDGEEQVIPMHKETKEEEIKRGSETYIWNYLSQMFVLALFLIVNLGAMVIDLLILTIRVVRTYIIA